jgi:anti-sigma B factor antagonist
MAQTDARLRVRKEGGVVHVEFVDRNILDEANIQQIGEEIGALIDAEPQPKIVISFSNVDHLSSAALGALITIHNRMKAKQGQLRLANIDPQIHEVFMITKLNKLFEIHETTDQAVASLK